MLMLIGLFFYFCVSALQSLGVVFMLIYMFQLVQSLDVVLMFHLCVSARAVAWRGGVPGFRLRAGRVRGADYQPGTRGPTGPYDRGRE